MFFCFIGGETFLGVKCRFHCFTYTDNIPIGHGIFQKKYPTIYHLFKFQTQKLIWIKNSQFQTSQITVFWHGCLKITRVAFHCAFRWRFFPVKNENDAARRDARFVNARLKRARSRNIVKLAKLAQSYFLLSQNGSETNEHRCTVISNTWTRLRGTYL